MIRRCVLRSLFLFLCTFELTLRRYWNRVLFEALRYFQSSVIHFDRLIQRILLCIVICSGQTASTDFFYLPNWQLSFIYIDVDVNEINFSLQNLVSCQDNYEKTRFVPGKNWFINKPLKTFNFESSTCLFDLYLPRQDKVLEELSSAVFCHNLFLISYYGFLRFRFLLEAVLSSYQRSILKEMSLYIFY